MSVCFHTIDLDAGIGANPGAGAATDAAVRICHEGIMIAPVVHFIGLEGESGCRACHNTQVASLTLLYVDAYGASDFCHVYIVVVCFPSRSRMRIKRVITASSGNCTDLLFLMLRFTKVIKNFCN